MDSNVTCTVCERSWDEGRRVCRECGAIRENPVALEDQRQVLRELHALMSSVSDAAHSMDREDAHRFEKTWHNAFFPTDRDLLIEEVLWCRSFFEVEAAIERAEGALTRLELLAANDPELQKKLPVIKKVVESKRKQERREILYVLLFILVLLAAIIWVVAWIVGRIFPEPIQLEAPAGQ